MDNEIKNKLGYYKKVAKNLDNLDLKKEILHEDFEDLTDEIEHIACTVDKYFCNNLLDWIELVSNTDLHNALKSLTPEEQILLSYVYYKEKTQTEIAKICCVAQKNISKKLSQTLRKIKKMLLGN